MWERPVKHHLHVVPHVGVPVLIDGKAEDDGDEDGHTDLMIVGGSYARNMMLETLRRCGGVGCGEGRR